MTAAEQKALPPRYWRVVNTKEPTDKPMWWARGPISPEACLGYDGECYVSMTEVTAILQVERAKVWEEAALMCRTWSQTAWDLDDESMQSYSHASGQFMEKAKECGGGK